MRWYIKFRLDQNRTCPPRREAARGGPPRANSRFGVSDIIQTQKPPPLLYILEMYFYKLTRVACVTSRTNTAASDKSFTAQLLLHKQNQLRRMYVQTRTIRKDSRQLSSARQEPTPQHRIKVLPRNFCCTNRNNFGACMFRQELSEKIRANLVLQDKLHIKNQHSSIG